MGSLDTAAREWAQSAKANRLPSTCLQPAYFSRQGGLPMSERLLPTRQGVPGIVPFLLSFTAGFVDSFTVLALFGLFVAQVTGSFVLMAVAFVKDEQGALIKLLAVPVFLLAGAATTVFAVVLERRGRAALPW